MLPARGDILLTKIVRHGVRTSLTSQKQWTRGPKGTTSKKTKQKLKPPFHISVNTFRVAATIVITILGLFYYYYHHHCRGHQRYHHHFVVTSSSNSSSESGVCRVFR